MRFTKTQLAEQVEKIRKRDRSINASLLRTACFCCLFVGGTIGYAIGAFIHLESFSLFPPVQIKLVTE